MNVTSETVFVWFSFLDEIQDEVLLSEYQRMLPPDELERYQKFRIDKARKRFLVGRLLLRTVLGGYLETKPELIVFARTRHGRPYLQEQVRKGDLQFSLSYTDGLVAVALHGGTCVGMDVENTDSQINCLDIAQRYFTPDECRELQELSAPLRKTRFFEMWTLKEAFMKAQGLGLKMALDELSFAGHEQAGTHKNTGFTMAHRNKFWQFWLLNPGVSCKAAVCVEIEAEMTPQLHCKKKIPLISEDDFALPLG